jgi:hypothetical protein
MVTLDNTSSFTIITFLKIDAEFMELDIFKRSYTTYQQI